MYSAKAILSRIFRTFRTLLVLLVLVIRISFPDIVILCRGPAVSAYTVGVYLVAAGRAKLSCIRPSSVTRIILTYLYRILA